LTVYFADTSAVSKRYVTETGSTWVRGWIAPVAGNQIIVSELSSIEMISLFRRRQREGSISLADLHILSN